MKKLLALMLALVMAVGMTACGGNKTNKELVDTFNKASAAFDEVATYFNEKKDTVPAEVMTGMTQLSEELSKYKAMAEDSSKLSEEEIKAAMDFLAGVPDAVKVLKEAVDSLASGGTAPGGAVTIPVGEPTDTITKEQLDELAALLTTAVPMFNEIQTAAQANGWTEDETTAQEIQTCYAVIQATSESVATPTMFDGTEDMAGYIAQVKEICAALPDLLAKVSQPAAK